MWTFFGTQGILKTGAFYVRWTRWLCEWYIGSQLLDAVCISMRDRPPRCVWYSERLTAVNQTTATC